MAGRISFASEITHLLYSLEPNPIQACIQCGTCSSACPLAEFMDHPPRQIIAMVRADQKRRVLGSNAYWLCASCYQCTVRCPAGIDIAHMMYGLKRYAMWKNGVRSRQIGPDFSRRFVRMIMTHGRSFEPGLAVPYLFRRGLRDLLEEARTAVALLARRRLPVTPHRIRRIKNFRGMLARIIPAGRAA